MNFIEIHIQYLGILTNIFMKLVKNGLPKKRVKIEETKVKIQK